MTQQWLGLPIYCIHADPPKPINWLKSIFAMTVNVRAVGICAESIG